MSEYEENQLVGNPYLQCLLGCGALEVLVRQGLVSSLVPSKASTALKHVVASLDHSDPTDGRLDVLGHKLAEEP